MGRMSEEQWKDLKLKFTVLLVLIAIAIPVFAVGPGLPKILEYTRKHQKEPWAQKWYFYIGRTYEITGRDEKGLETYYEFYQLYRGDEEEHETQFEEIAEELKRPDERLAYIPWEAAKYDEDSRPPSIIPKRSEFLGKVLLQVAKQYENRRDYLPARWIWACVFKMWPAGSEEQQRAANSRKLDATRPM